MTIHAMPEPREGSSTVVVTHNWCDPTTWYTQSVAVSGEVLEDSGDGLTFNSDHINWVDLNHGKMYREDLIKAAYLPVVRVNGTEKAERTPFADSGGDFAINYETGSVTFTEAPSGTITADYFYATGSMFIIQPKAGKVLQVEESEVQFSKDIDLNDSTHFQAFVYNPSDLPNKMPAIDLETMTVIPPTTYKTLKDYIDEARGVYPEIPAMGGDVRGVANAVMTFPFEYGTIKALKSSIGLEIRIWLENDQSFGGEFGTASFYCTSKDE